MWGAHLLAPVANHALLLRRAATVLLNRPVSLSFAFAHFSSPGGAQLGFKSFFARRKCFCFLRHTIYDIRTWCRRWDFFSPLASLVLLNRPVSLSFAFAHFSSPGGAQLGFKSLFAHRKCFCFLRHTIYDLGAGGGI